MAEVMMRSAGTIGANSLSIAGRGIRLAAKARFKDPSAAIEAVQELMERPEVLERWATYCLNHDDNPEPGQGLVIHSFRFADIPPAYRKGAMESVAVAYLAAGEPVPKSEASEEREEVQVEFGA